MKTRKSLKAVLSVSIAASTVSALASSDYGPAQWYGACNYSGSGYGKRVFVIHDMEGYFWSSIYYLARCSTQASVHYCVNGKKDVSSDSNPGAVVQMVRDANYAWHARCWNPYSMGTEHEGFAGNPAWYTEAMYEASASVTKAKCNKYNMAKDRNHVIAHGQESVPGWGSWANNNLPAAFDPYCNTHHDPGAHWKWEHYMDLVKGVQPKPHRPTSLKAKVVSWQRIDLKWQDNSNNENHFEIQRMNVTGGGSWNDIHHNNPNDREYHVTGLAGNTKYKFRVRASNGAGNSDWSNTEVATTFNHYPPDKPTGLTAVANNDDKITLTWNDNSNNEDGFTIHQNNGTGTGWTKIKDTNPNVTSYQVTGLRGNRTYQFRVRAFNTAKNSPSDWTNTASDTTPPTAPSGLVVTAKSTSSIFLKWDDNAGAEVGFKIERSLTSGSGFSQVATNAASDSTYTDTSLAADTKYYYRVRTYNANGNSQYSNEDSATTWKTSPVISAIGNKTVAVSTPLSFRVSSTDPNQVTDANNFEDFQSYTAPTTDGHVMFKTPTFSTSTSLFIDTTANNYTQVVNDGPSGNGSTKTVQAHWKFKTGSTYWMRLATKDANQRPNPVVSLNQTVRFKIYSDKAIKLAIGIRETTNNPVIGGDGGAIGDIEWVGVTNKVNGVPQCKQAVPANTWTTVFFNCQKNDAWPFSGATADGDIKTGKGVLEHVAIVPDGWSSGLINVYMDDFSAYTNNTLTFSLDAAPSGMTINPYSGDIDWTPAAGQLGNFSVTVRVTDQSNKTDTQTFIVTVTGGANNPPALTAIGSKTVNEGALLSFTASASDPDAGQTKTFSLDAGNPSGSSINSSSGAFTWTPSESQGGTTNTITIRVTDNGSPALSDFETITVIVNEMNAAPTLTAVADQTINEGQTFNLTLSGSDSDIPAQTKTYALLLGPSTMTINTNTGALSWTSVEGDGPDTNQITVRVTDNGSPKLWAERTFNLVVNEANTAPTITVSNAASTATVLTDFENYEDGTYNGTIMFRQPSYSGSTSSFLDTALANATTVETNSPGGVESAVLISSFAFKTGQSNPWLRMTTDSVPGNEYALPNPTIDLSKHLKFDIYSDKSIKICLGVRETGTQVPLGDDGGQSGAIEWVGASGVTGGAPICTRTIAANTWTTLDFDLPNEVITAFTGNGSLLPGKGTLEHIAIVPNGGSGIHNVYVDNFVIYQSSTNFTVNTGEELSLQCFANDTDSPAQNLTFSLDAGAPTNAVINDESGEITWIPEPSQSPSTNFLTVRVTDDGPGALSATATVTIKVIKVNTPPALSRPSDFVLEQNTSQTITFTNEALDADIPANNLTFSLAGTIPSGASIHPATGVFTWTPSTSVITNHYVTVRVTDDGSPALYMEKQFAVMIVSANTAPTLSLGTARVTETFANYESFGNNTADGTVMFRKPTLAAQTSSFIDTAVTNYTKITNSFPSGGINPGARVLVAKWNFKTGTTDYWVRLTTTNATSLPNPTIDLGARVKFNIHSSKNVKVAIGVRETGTSADIGANGGTTGGIEWLGVTNVISGKPVPNRLVPANTWTTLEFILPSEPCTNFSGGNSVLASGKGVLEHIVIRGEGGTGAYTVYLDNFEVVNTTALPGTVTMKVNSALQFTASATDPNPGAGLMFSMDADFQEAHTNATLDSTNGAFSWTPAAGDAGTTNSLSIRVEDEPTNGGIPKNDLKTLTVIVNTDSLGPLNANSSSFVAGGDDVALSWDSIAGTTYKVQSQTIGSSTWTDVLTVTASGSVSSIAVSNPGNDAHYRVVEVGSGADQ